MLRINLLPPYIYENKKRNVAFAVSGLLTVAALGLCMYFYFDATKALDDANNAKTVAQAHKDQYDKYGKDTEDVKTAIKAIEDRQTFVANSKTYNKAWPDTYEMMRDVTSPAINMKSMSIAAGADTTVNMAAFARTEMDAARWWMQLRNNEKFKLVSFNLPSHPYEPGGSAAGGGGNPYGGIRAGGGGSSPFGGGGGPNIATMASASGGSAPRGGSSPFGGGNPYAARGGGGGGGAQGEVGPGEVEGRLVLNFTAVAVLTEPFAKGTALPSWGGSGGAAAGGPGGGYGGFGGGRGGGVPSGPPSASFGGGGGAPAAAAPASGGTPSLRSRGKSGGDD